MKKITQKLFFLIAVMGVSLVSAQVVPTGFWAPIGDVTIEEATNDDDNGDGIADGALKINGQSLADGQGASFTFNGKIQDGQSFAVASAIYNKTGNYVKLRVSLHNKTDDRQLALYTFQDDNDETQSLITLNTGNPLEMVAFNYTAVPDDAGDVLELRYVREDGGATARDFWIDNASLNGVFVTEEIIVEPISAAGTWGVVDEDFVVDGDLGPTILKGFGDDPIVREGTILVDGKNTTKPQGAKFTLDETMTAGKRYVVETTLYNPRSSYINVKLQLYNVTEAKALATSGQLKPVASNGAPAAGSVTYDASASDAGDVLEIRWLRDDDGNLARDFGIEVATINGTALDFKLLSVKNNEFSQGISIYPNPSNTFLNIKSRANVTIKRVMLIDVTGKEIFRQNKAKSIDVSNFAKGLYILKAESQEGATTSKKVLVN